VEQAEGLARCAHRHPAGAGQHPRFRELPAPRAHGGEAGAGQPLINYIIRRVLYAIPILIGVNLITFALFFVVNTPDDMARMQLGTKRVTPDAIEKWKVDHGYDKPLLWNGPKTGFSKFSDTIFFEKSLKLFA